MNSLADYISPNIGDYMKYDTAAGRKASLVDFLKIYFSDEKGRVEERIAEDNEVRASKREGDDNYNNYISNYNKNFNRSKDLRAPNTITLADLLPKVQNSDNDRIRRSKRDSSSKTVHKDTNPNNLTFADIYRPDASNPRIKTFIKDDD